MPVSTVRKAADRVLQHSQRVGAGISGVGALAGATTNGVASILGVMVANVVLSPFGRGIGLGEALPSIARDAAQGGARGLLIGGAVAGVVLVAAKLTRDGFEDAAPPRQGPSLRGV
jgi:hypothetical protein